MCAAEDTGNGKKGSGLRLLSRSARQWKSLHAENAKVRIVQNSASERSSLVLCVSELFLFAWTARQYQCGSKEIFRR